MAEVLEGIAEGESGFRRRVAVKRILPALAEDAACARMFLDEARIASHLHHASIVAVLDFGTLDGVPFQVLEFVDGLDLERIAKLGEERGTRLPVGLALHIANQVAHALDHAHRATDEAGAPLGIVHRDVSPANVLVSWDGHVKLGDFGIALAENRLERTQNDGIKGKLEYMSPEQATRGAVDARSDVFALGCTLHRLLTGKSPLGDLSALTRLIAGEEVELDASLPGDIAQVIRKAIHPSRVERHASAADLARALGELGTRHLSGDATFALRTYLASLRDVPQKPKRGALDMLLDVELVLAGDDEARAYTSRHAAHATTAREPVPPPGEPTAPAPSEAASHRSSRGFLLAIAFAFAIAGLATGYALWPAPKLVAPSPPPVASEVPVAQLPAPLPTENETAVEATDPVAPDKPTRASRHPRTAKPAPVATAPEPAAEGRGTLVIGGARAHRAEIRIDGRSQGYAPKRLDLAAGAHEIVLVQPDGTRVGPHTVEIEPRHTASAPAKWIVE